MSDHKRVHPLNKSSPRVRLRRPSECDADEFIGLMRASRRFHRPWVTPPLDVRSYREYVTKSHSHDFLGLLVCRKADDRILGTCNLSQIVRGRFWSACLGYYLGTVYAGQGYMSEAVELLLSHVFRRLKLHRVEANIQPENIKSLRLVERCGFQREGYSPRFLKIGNRWRDHERWAIHREVWRSNVRTTRSNECESSQA